MKKLLLFTLIFFLSFTVSQILLVEVAINWPVFLAKTQSLVVHQVTISPLADINNQETTSQVELKNPTRNNPLPDTKLSEDITTQNYILLLAVVGGFTLAYISIQVMERILKSADVEIPQISWS